MAKLLKLLRKQLKCKYSICLSNQVIDRFMRTKTNMVAESMSGYDNIEKEVKHTGQEINRKRHYFNKEAVFGRRKVENLCL